MNQMSPKRLHKEIEHAKDPSMESQGIFYSLDDVNMMVGKALIIGPEGTPYEGCLLCFRVEFPPDYPFSSPKVLILTSDGVTRFHPNLYVDGKVCLSILGTWRGPKWAPVMTISTVLSTIQSLLEANPIVNEPTHEHRTLADADDKARNYAELVQFRLIAHTLRGLQAWKKGTPIPEHRGFEDVLAEHGDAYMERLMRIIERKAAEGDKMYKGVFYCMEGLASWSALLERAKLLKAET